MNRSTVGIVLTGMLVGLGCERNEPDRSTRPAPAPSTTSTPSTPSTTPSPSTRSDSGVKNDHSMNDQEIARWRTQLVDTRVKVDALRAKAANSSDAIKADFQGAVSSLSDQVDMIQSRLNDLKTSTQSNWDSARQEVEGMFTRLNNTLRDVQAKYGGTTTPSPAPEPVTPPSIPPSPTPDQPTTPPSTPPTQPGPG